jgi:hypothetical protein
VAKHMHAQTQEMIELSCEDVEKNTPSWTQRASVVEGSAFVHPNARQARAAVGTVNLQKCMGVVRAHERHKHGRVGQDDPQHAECPQPVKTRQSGWVLVGCKESRRASTCEYIDVTKVTCKDEVCVCVCVCVCVRVCVCV